MKMARIGETLVVVGLLGVTHMGLAGAAPAAKNETESETPSRPNVVVVLIDTTRPDYLGMYGFDRETAPFLGRLAAESVVFDHAFSTSSWTAPATASLFTSLYPHQHGVVRGFATHPDALKRPGELSREDVVRMLHGGGPPKPEETEPVERVVLNRFADTTLTMPEIFKSAGYETFGVAANPHIGVEIGFDRGFEKFVRINDAPANRLVDQALEWTKDVPADRPYLLYVHLNDPHSPYVRHDEYYKAPSFESADFKHAEASAGKMAPAKVREAWGLRSDYLSELGFVDSQLERIYGALVDDRPTLFVVVSDHGEEFLDHGFVGHMIPRLYDELNRVVMLFHGPKFGIGSGRIELNVSLIDVLPSLLDLAGIEAPAQLRGRSLLPLLEASNDAQLRKTLEDRTVIAHRLHVPRGKGSKRLEGVGRTELWAAIQGPWKMIRKAEKVELFNLDRDPDEQLDVAPENAKIVAGLERSLEAIQEDQAADPAGEVQVPVDQELREQLKALGYVE